MSHIQEHNFSSDNMFAYIYRTVYETGHMYVGAITATHFNSKYTGSGGKRFQNIDSIYKNTAIIEILEVIYKPDGHDFKRERERYWIHSLNAQNLEIYLNVKPGGEGVNCYDYMTEDEILKHKQKLSDMNTGKNNPMYGIHLSGKLNHNYGKHLSEIQKQTLSKKLSGKNATWYGVKGSDHPRAGKSISDKHKQNISDANKGKSISDITRNKMSQSRKSYYQRNPDAVSGESNPMYGRTHSELSKEKNRQIALNRKPCVICGRKAHNQYSKCPNVVI